MVYKSTVVYKSLIFYLPWQGWRGSRAALDQQELGFYRSLASMND